MTKQVTNPTRITATVLGITLALGGLVHGFFEILQGNKRTPGLIIQSISPEFQRWPNGEEAFTLVPNFLITGMLAVGISLLIIIWSAAFIHKKPGRLVFLILFLLLTLAGGGIGHVVFFLPVWGYATRMHKPLTGWRKVLPRGFRRIMARSRLWQIGLVITVLCFITALIISVFGLPGDAGADLILAVCWSFLLGALIFMNLTFIAGFAARLEQAA